MTAIESRNGRHYDLRSTLVVSGFVLQVAALVWGAAKLSASVDELKRTADKLVRSMEATNNKVYEHDGRIRVLEDRSAARPGRRETP